MSFCKVNITLPYLLSSVIPTFPLFNSFIKKFRDVQTQFLSKIECILLHVHRSNSSSGNLSTFTNSRFSLLVNFRCEFWMWQKQVFQFPIYLSVAQMCCKNDVALGYDFVGIYYDIPFSLMARMHLWLANGSSHNSK